MRSRKEAGGTQLGRAGASRHAVAGQGGSGNGIGGAGRMRLALACLVAAVVAAPLAGCGGGGDSGAASGTAGTSANSPSTPATPLPAVPALIPACSGCAVVDAHTYAGSGTGIWEVSNSGSAAVEVPVSIAGLNGQDVSLVFTNESGTAQVMPAIALTASRSGSRFPAAMDSLQLQTPAPDVETTRRRVADFNRDGWALLAGSKQPLAFSVQSAAPAFSVQTSSRTWYHVDDSARTATLRKQVTTSDHVTVNFWVENGEEGAGKIDSTMLDGLAAAYASPGGIYDTLKAVGGPMWGPQSFATLIDGNNQPIDIVILNFDHNGRPYDLVGYFYARNNFRKGSEPLSNESISLYLDAETLYLGGAAGVQQMRMTMAHEGLHMQNFYRRGVQKGSLYMFDTWLEEATAMMMEDFASYAVDPTYNAIRDVRFRDYVSYGAGSYNCNLTVWRPFDSGVCDSYSVSGAFGGFLDRHLGLGFYANLLGNFSSTDSVAVLDNAIRAVRPASGFHDQFALWSATSAALMPANGTPADYGYPVWSDGNFVLQEIDPALYEARRTLTSVLPATLQAYASLPVVRQAVRGNYAETVKVPAGTRLSVVIHD